MILSADEIKCNVIKKQTGQVFIAPHPALRPYIAHYTCAFPEQLTDGKLLSLVPDASGCLIFIVQQNQILQRAFGPTTKTVIVGSDQNIVLMRFFIEFRPGGFHALTSIPQSLLTDLTPDLSQVLPKLSQKLHELYLAHDHLDAFIQSVDQYLLCMLPVNTSSLFHDAVTLLHRSNGRMTLKQLAEKTYYSERHINRIFQMKMGMNVKLYERILKINQILAMMNNDVSLYDLAYSYDYYDQSHFIHDFKMITGLTPKKYMKQQQMFYREPIKLDMNDNNH